LEILEDRTLLSTFVWTNRGSALSDTDSFNAVFGVNADTARAVVDSGLLTWQNIIQNFNFADGSNTFSLSISMDPPTHGNGAVAWTGAHMDGRGRPTGGRIVFDSGWDGHGGGYYLDSNPNSPAFEGDLLNPYVRNATPGTQASTLADFYTVLMHEMLHTLGLVSNPGYLLQLNPYGYLRNTGRPDTANYPGTLFTFTGPDVKALLTSDETGSSDLGRAEHTATAGDSYTDPVTHITYTGTLDAVNPFYQFGRRMLPSLQDVMILKDAYGYTVNMPPSFWTTTTSHIIATGTGPGAPPLVQVYDGVSGAMLFNFYAYGPSLLSGIQVAVGDVNGDGIPDIITAPGPGGPPDVRVFDGATGKLIQTFYPYAANFTGGVSVAVGDVSGDGYDDIVTGALSGNPDVRVYSGKDIANGTFDPNGASLLAHWFPYALMFNVGVHVAVGDVSGNGYADIVTGPSAGNPDVRVYSGHDIADGTFDPNGASLLAQWFPYALMFNVGANVAVGEVNGDGHADIVTGATIGNPHVKVYSGKDIADGTFDPSGASVLAQFFAYGLQYDIGANVAVGDVSTDGYADVITGSSAGSTHVKVYSGRAIASHCFNCNNPDGSLLQQFMAYAQFGAGVTVGAQC
jgi:hypothetical protein